MISEFVKDAGKRQTPRKKVIGCSFYYANYLMTQQI